MYDINHQVGIKASPAEVYQLLTTDAGLSRWWTSDTRGAGDVGSTIDFRFNDTVVNFTVAELVPDTLVRWSHAGAMPPEWMGTGVSFRLKVDQGQTLLRFAHENWQEPSDFMAHCSTKWAVFMLSLKDCLETGTGRPFPDDLHIDHS